MPAQQTAAGAWEGTAKEREDDDAAMAAGVTSLAGDQLCARRELHPASCTRCCCC